MVVSQDTLKELFYYISANTSDKFLPEQIAYIMQEAKLERYFPKYFIDATIQEGWMAGFLEKVGNEYKLTVRGKARVDLISKEDLSSFNKMIMEAW